MSSWSIAGLLILLLAVPVQAGEPEPFDPDQPFKQALEERLVESLLAEALDVFHDHVEISGRLDPDSFGTEPQRLQFKFYPKGKSQSDDHFAAEGWVGPSRDSRQQEFHFHFSVPKSSGDIAPEPRNNVL